MNQLFVGEHNTIDELVSKVQMHNQGCGAKLSQEATKQHGHVLSVVYKCSAGHTVQWDSSSRMGSQYTVNCQLVLAYLCSGMLPSKFERFCEFGKLGYVSYNVYKQLVCFIAAAAELHRRQSIYGALYEEMRLNSDVHKREISIETDARHACRKNSEHTDVVALGMNSHKVVNHQHITKKDDDTCTQRHELIGVQRMYNDFDKLDIKVVDHAHNRNLSVNKHLRENRTETHNSNDRWHAAKSLAAAMKKISVGPNKNIGKTWHPELSDKRASFRNHVYWAMDNCGGDPEKLQFMMDNVVCHFQNNHQNCDINAKCRLPGHIPSLKIITDPFAVNLLSSFIKSSVVYKNTNDYVQSRDTYHVESFNNTCLIYLDKRIHYQNEMYGLRINLAVLDWNEHVGRAYTSVTCTKQTHIKEGSLGRGHTRRKQTVL